MSSHSPIPARDPCHHALWPCSTFPSLLTGKEINVWIPVLLILLFVCALRIVVSCARCLRRRSRGAPGGPYDDAADAASDTDDGLPRYSDSIGFGSDMPVATHSGGPPRLVARAHDDPYVAGVASLLSLGAPNHTATPDIYYAAPRPVANATGVQKLIAELRAISEEPAGEERAARTRDVQRRLTALVLADPRYALALGTTLPPGPPPAYSYSDTPARQ
ncbi:hypothetical protein HYPSUDRAFT_393563 [Hypholoma sublateritium FD-334 SS-4]|uniref:Uncharacterized protein n=1 Tax=Hypholoma sublateritium (strain FD-334 SS-4) TaxID=945553 RepID=A0A0D2NF62_HYPSF|nr:hypothetical protein HYPSUDRAFT_393563 [Hypholoma sublateritium FD-334 SS-4]